MKQRLFAIFLVFLLLATVLPATSSAAAPVGVSLDGSVIAFTAASGAPFIDANGRTQVPLRAVMERFGCTVGWNGSTRVATCQKGGLTVSVPIGAKYLTAGTARVAMDTAAQIVGGRTYLPIRAVLEAFGATVLWDGGARVVRITSPGANAPLQVHFIDVGQADSILITCGGEAMLIDAGNNDDAALVTAYLTAHGITKLKYAVGTHPHEDHIGGMDAVIEQFAIGTLLMPKVQANTQTFEDVLDAAAAKKLTITAPTYGQTYSLGTAKLTALNCLATTDLNNASIILRLSFGGHAFLFTGDAEKEAESAVLAKGAYVQSDVLKVGHHGSSTATSAAFLAAVKPAVAVISCGAVNSYGHPHAETLAALSKVTLYRTDLRGTVIATVSGASLSWSTQKSAPQTKPAAATTPAATQVKPAVTPPAAAQTTSQTYILNTNTKKFHYPTCASAKKISAKNRRESTESRTAIIAQGYAPCKNCNP